MNNIDTEQVQELHLWFSQYAESFKDGDKVLRDSVILKENHTRNVCKEIDLIGRELGLNENELLISDCMALLHDVGRFEQFRKYKTFSDSRSENHSELGLRIIKEFDVLRNFSDDVADLICRAVRYHNRASLPDDETKECIYYSKLLRDADKLDIWRVVIEYYHRKDRKKNGTIELNLPDTLGYTQKVYDQVIKHEIVMSSNMKNLNDFKLLQIGWVFDINFKPALRAVKERKYVEQICEVLPVSDETARVLREIQGYYRSELEVG